MATKPINTVVAKALISQLLKEANDDRRIQIPHIKSHIENSSELKRMKKLYADAQKMSQQARAIEQKLEGKPPKGYRVSVYASGEVRVDADSVRVDEDYIQSEIILLGHAGKTVEQIRAAIKLKYFKS